MWVSKRPKSNEKGWLGKIIYNNWTLWLLPHLFGECMTLQMLVGREALGSSVILLKMIWWETMGPVKDVDITLTRTTHLMLQIKDKIPFTRFNGNIFPDGNGRVCPDKKQNCFRKDFEVLIQTANISALSSVKHLWDVLNKYFQHCSVFAVLQNTN